MSYFRADEQLEGGAGHVPAAWGLQGVAQRVGGAVELAVTWQRPRVSLDQFSVLLLTEAGASEVARVDSKQSGVQVRLEGYASDRISVTVIAWRDGIASPPSPPLTLDLSPLPLIVTLLPTVAPAPSPAVTSQPAVSIAPPPASGEGLGERVSVELVDDLAAIDIALGEANAFLGKNGVFVRFKNEA